MNIIFGWLLTPIFYLLYILILVVFHPIQVLARSFGYSAHKHVVDLMNFTLMYSLKILGTKFYLPKNLDLPLDRPLIIVSNHQALFDIPLLHCLFYKHHPKYISKIELGKNLPSVSYNLRHGGSVLINRSDRKQSVEQIEKLGRYINDNNYAAVIFPEGTRARDGIMKDFKGAGLLTLMKAAPRALVVPVVIDGHYSLLKNKGRPIPVGVAIKVNVLSPLDPQLIPPKEIIKITQDSIRKALNQEPTSDPHTTASATLS